MTLKDIARPVVRLPLANRLARRGRTPHRIWAKPDAANNRSKNIILFSSGRLYTVCLNSQTLPSQAGLVKSAKIA